MPHFSPTTRIASGNAIFFHLHNELEDVSAHPAPKAMINLLQPDARQMTASFQNGMDTGRMNSVRTFQPHVFAHHANHVRLLFLRDPRMNRLQPCVIFCDARMDMYTPRSRSRRTNPMLGGGDRYMSQRFGARLTATLAICLCRPDPQLDAVYWRATASGLPKINVSPSQGKLLLLLARIQGARISWSLARWPATVRSGSPGRCPAAAA